MDLLHKLLLIQSPSFAEGPMIRFIQDYCRSIGCQVRVKNKNVYVVKGRAEAYPCMVAHTDTVFPFIPQKHLEVFYYGDMILGRNTKEDTYTGLGMDDKIGIWIALQMLQQKNILKCFFPHGEEAGAVGSRKADMSFFKDVSYCIQCDRQGNRDLVTDVYWTQICSDGFLNDVSSLMTKYSYRQSPGMLTDVYQLVNNGIGKSCINLSTGYYNPHKMDEYAVVPDVINTLDFVSEVIDTLAGKVYLLPTTQTRRYSGFYNTWKNAYSKPEQERCEVESYPSTHYDHCLECGNYGVLFDEIGRLCLQCYNIYYEGLLSDRGSKRAGKGMDHNHDEFLEDLPY